jgi:hypothetical protein
MTRSLCILALLPAAMLAIGQTASQPASNLDFWLAQAATASSAAAPRQQNPRGPDSQAAGESLPGVLVLSDDTVLAGRIYTTLDKDLEVWEASQQRYRGVPPVLVLSISAVVVSQETQPEWRWKEMGSEERVYTGRQQPLRRLEWKLHLIDDSYITGSIKGQPLWVRTADDKTHGPYLLSERQTGQPDQTLAQLLYVKQVVFSRRAMEEAGK